MTGGSDRPLLVATDVDGTLIGTDDLVPAANAEAIAAVVDAGSDFVLATGRPPRWLPQIVEQLPVSPIAVCANGSVVVDTASGEVLHADLLEPDTLAAIDEVVRRRLPGCGIAAERLGEDAADAEFVACPDYEHAWLIPEHLQVGHDEVLESPVLKMLARMPGMTSGDMVAALGDELDELATVTYSTTNGLIEFAVRGTSKASALRRLAGELGVDGGVAGAAPVTVAFGDMPNDLEMLEWAGLGVAMGNALPEVRAAADEVTLSNDEAGLAHVLRRWF